MEEGTSTQLSRKETTSFRFLLRTQIKNGRKRITLSILSGIMIFLILTAFLMVWFSYRYNTFTSYLAREHEWRDDQKISAYYSTITASFEPAFPQSYLNDLITEISAKLNTIIPEVITDNATAAMTVELYLYHSTSFPVQTDHYELTAFNDGITNLLAENLIEGRMPENTKEILYYRESNNSNTFHINDSVELRAFPRLEAYEQNFTIVGIVDNLKKPFYSEGYSLDILEWQRHIENYRYLFFCDEKFFTTIEYFIEIMNNYPVQNCGRAVLIDFNYCHSAIDARKISTYLKEFQEVFRTATILEAEPEESFSLYLDLFSALATFQVYWAQETFKIIALSSPLLFLLVLVCIETFNLGALEVESSFKLMKLQGLDNRTIRKAIFFEELLFAGVSLIGGVMLGVLLGFLFVKIGYNLSLKYYLSGLNEPIFLISLGCCFISFLTGAYLYSNALLRKTIIKRSEQFKIKPKKTIQKLFSQKEFIALIPGLIILTVGIFLVAIFPEATYLRVNASIQDTIKAIIAWALTYIGLVSVTISAFFLLAKGFTVLWSFIGKKWWESKKNFFTLSLKSLSATSENYRRVIFVILMVGLGAIPGIVMKTSINHHLPFEANLAVGCTDLIIPHWNPSTSPQVIEGISNVELATSITHVFIEYKYSTPITVITYSIAILALHNPTKFSQVIDLSKIRKIDYTVGDIKALETNLTYLMNKDYAKKMGYDKGKIFKSSNLGRTSKNYDLTYVNCFNFFPTVARAKQGLFQSEFIPYNIVTSLKTENLLESTLDNPMIYKEHSLLVKLSPGGDIINIKETIKSNYGLVAFSSSDIKETLWGNTNNFALNYLLISTILTLFITAFFGFVTARNIYQERLRVTEAEYRSGAKRTQIWQGFTIEMITIAIIPMAISTAIGGGFLQLLGNLFLEKQQTYVKFSPWISWWLILLIYIFGIGTIISGWLLVLIPQINNYQPVKQE